MNILGYGWKSDYLSLTNDSSTPINSSCCKNSLSLKKRVDHCWNASCKSCIGFAVLLAFFESKLRKSNDDLFFGRHKGKLETFAKFLLQRHWKLCAKIPPYAHCKSLRQQAVWKLLSEIFRTAPVYHYIFCARFFNGTYLLFFTLMGIQYPCMA